MIPYVLNLADLVLTLNASIHGATELNPYMSDIGIMIFWKTVVVGAACFLLEYYAYRGNRFANVGLLLSAIVYSALAGWHVGNLFVIWFM